MISVRTRDSLIPLLVLFGIVALVLLLYSRVAHAAGEPAPASASGLPLEAWIGIALGAFAGIRAIVDALLAFFKAEAPLTKTLVDDHIRDSLQGLHDGLAKLNGTVNGLVDLAKPPGGVRVVSGGAAMLAVLLLGGLLAVGATSCTHDQRATLARDAKSTLINCTAQPLGTTPGLDLGTLAAIVNLTAAERLKCMTPTGLDWKCVETDAIGQGVTLGGCALAQMVAAAAKAMASSASSLAAADPAPPPGRAELEDFRKGVAPDATLTFHTSNGDL